MPVFSNTRSFIALLSAMLVLACALGVNWSGAPLAGKRHEPVARAAEFELKDQYDKPVSYRFPKSRITVLTFGDRQGSEQIEGWVRPLYARYQERIEQYGVAVLSSVPAVMRGLVRGIFKSKVKYSVLLDWKGEVAKAFQYERRQANVFVIDRAGRILYRSKGPATEAELQRLYAQIDRQLAAPSPGQ